MVHQVEEDLFFALKVVVETALAELQRGGHIVHGRGIVSLLLKQAGRGAKDFLAWVEGRFSGHGKNIHGQGHCGLATVGRANDHPPPIKT